MVDSADRPTWQSVLPPQEWPALLPAVLRSYTRRALFVASDALGRSGRVCTSGDLETGGCVGRPRRPARTGQLEATREEAIRVCCCRG